MFDDDMFFTQMRKMFRDVPFFNDDVWNLYESGEVPNGQPIVWGYQYTVGPDGVPHYSTYSNVAKLQKQLNATFGHQLSAPSSDQVLPDRPIPTDKDGYRTPQTDVVEDEGNLRVIVELPGVDKKNIEVSAKETFLTVTTNHDTYKYKVELPLKVTTIPKKIKASFKNGILELKLPIVKTDKQDKGDQVTVE